MTGSSPTVTDNSRALAGVLWIKLAPETVPTPKAAESSSTNPFSEKTECDSYPVYDRLTAVKEPLGELRFEKRH